MALTKGNSVVWTNDIGKGITMNVSVSEYYDASTGKFYVGVDTVQILSQTDWYIGYSYYLDGTITVGGHTILNASGYAGTFGTGWMGSYNVYYPFGSLSNAAGSYNTGWLASCSNGSSMTVSVNLTVLRPSGYTDAAHGVNLTGSQTLSFKHSTGHTNTATGNLRSAATCTAAATYWYKCASCGAQSTSYFSSGSALGHKSVNGGTSGVHTKCSVCGATLSSTHTYTSTVQNAATCTTKGTTKYSCACGYSYTSENIAALGHNYSGTVIAPTCTEQGYTTYKCTRCNDTSKANDTYTAALGHNSVYAGIASAHTKCSRCGSILSAEHTYSSSIESEATCTTKGTTKYSCECGYYYTSDDIAALGHNYLGTIVSPTCTEQGYTKYICSRCNDASKAYDNYTAALGHNYVAVITRNPTSSSTGLITHTCSVCGDSYTEIIPKIKGSYLAYLKNKNGTSKHIPYVWNGSKWVRYTPYIKKTTGWIDET